MSQKKKAEEKLAANKRPSDGYNIFLLSMDPDGNLKGLPSSPLLPKISLVFDLIGISLGFLDFFYSSKFSDVTLVMPSGTEYKAHKLILAYSSLYFYELFIGSITNTSASQNTQTLVSATSPAKPKRKSGKEKRKAREEVDDAGSESEGSFSDEHNSDEVSSNLNLNSNSSHLLDGSSSDSESDDAIASTLESTKKVKPIDTLKLDYTDPSNLYDFFL